MSVSKVLLQHEVEQKQDLHLIRIYVAFNGIHMLTRERECTPSSVTLICHMSMTVIAVFQSSWVNYEP